MIKSITSLKVSGKRVILRAGFDVPLKQNIQTELWQVADDTRIREGLPTLKHLIRSKAKIVILSKLGRPQGWDENFSEWPVAQKLAELLRYKPLKITDEIPDYAAPHVYFLASDITKQDYSDLSGKISPGSILFLENMLFYPGEEASNKSFVQDLKKFGQIYVNDAFSYAHRKTASNFDLARELPAYGGITFLKEITALNKLLKSPRKPMIVLMGGAKIDDKVATMENLAKHADCFLVGGAIANTFFQARGYAIGKSKVSSASIAKQLLRNYKDKIVLPVDVVVADSPDGQARLSRPDKIGADEMIFDIGPETVRKFSAIIKTGKTLVWNGPFGLFEKQKFAFGSRSIARIFAARSSGAAYGVIGGGETIEVVNQAKVAEFIDHISTGGGAMLQFLAGEKLPAIKALENKS